MRRKDYSAVKFQPSAAPSLARSVIDKSIVYFHFDASRVDTLARKRLPWLAVFSQGAFLWE
jgi:hypothetical protein